MKYKVKIVPGTVNFWNMIAYLERKYTKRSLCWLASPWIPLQNRCWKIIS